MNPLDQPQLCAGFRLQWEPAQNAHVLLYPEGLIKLNASAGEILRRCDGTRTLSDVIIALESTFKQRGLTKDVNDFVAIAVASGWLHSKP